MMNFTDWTKDLDRREAEYLHVPVPVAVVDGRPLHVRFPLTNADILLLLKLDKAFE